MADNLYRLLYTSFLIIITIKLLILCALFGAALSRGDDWQPIVSQSILSYKTIQRPSIHPKIINRRPPVHAPYVSNKLSSLMSNAPPADKDTCSVYKVSMNQDLFYQYLEYEQDLPDLKEFTLCMWSKFHNHSQDHPLFSYAVGDSPKEISVWISNNEDASYLSMAVHGHSFFRLNYPLKLNTWYHSCMSWNGKTGEWQIWVNAERVGRGFNNRLVGHIIKGGGVAVTGQEQSLLHSAKGLEPKKNQVGLIGEITMLQMYHVALTAGKAHKDHKHHHAHTFRHDGTPIETSSEPITEPPPPPAIPLGNGNFFIGGQIQMGAKLNLAGSQPEQMVPIQLANGLQYQQQFVNGQLGNRGVSEQLINSLQIQGDSNLGVPQLFLSEPSQAYSVRRPTITKGSSVTLSGSLSNPANVQFIDDATHNIYKRQSQNRDKRDNPEKELIEEPRAGKKDKRGLIALSNGDLVDEALLTPNAANDADEEMQLFQQSLLDGLAGVVGNLPIQNLQKETVDEREPAEAEVKAVMQVCSGCVSEPFKKALVLSWRTTPKKLYSGAHFYKGLPICSAF